MGDVHLILVLGLPGILIPLWFQKSPFLYSAVQLVLKGTKHRIQCNTWSLLAITEA